MLNDNAPIPEAGREATCPAIQSLPAFLATQERFDNCRLVVNSLKAENESLKAQLAAQPSVQRISNDWIEVKNSLPKYRQVVLLLCEEAYQEVAVYRPDNYMCRWECHNGYKPVNVSHWKPLDWPSITAERGSK